MVTISTHNGSAVHQAHNLREEKVVSKEEHIDPNGIHETWIHESERHAYHRLFDESVKAYNEGQSRADRQIKNYYNSIRNDAKKHTSYEMIIGIYDKGENGVYQCSEEQGKEIMREFVEGWKERNPNLELIGAYYHADEQGEPHCHIDYIPVAHGYSRGMETQTGLVKALGEMGFEKQGKLTAQIQWEKRENDHFTRLCQKRGLEISHPKQELREHLSTETYKAEKALESALTHTRDLLNAEDEIRADINKLEAKREKEKAMRKVKEAEEYAERIKYNAEKIKTEANNYKTQAKAEFEEANNYNQKAKQNYLNSSEHIVSVAKEEFQNFIQGRQTRLENFCASKGILDEFNELEAERFNKILYQKHESVARIRL